MSEDVELTIGSDPEFVIMCGNSVENALEIFQKVSLDMECQCECPHPTQDEINDIYSMNIVEYLSEAVNNQDKNDLFVDYKDFAIKAMVELYEWHGYGEDNIIELLEEDIAEPDLKKISKTIKDVVIKYCDNPNFYFKYKKEFQYLDNEQKESIIEKAIYLHLDLEQMFIVLSNERQETFNEFFLSFIIEEYENKNLEDLPENTRVSIEIEIADYYEIDCSACQEGESYFCTTEIGCDGQSALGELRPKHGNDPIEHFNEILKLIEELSDLLSPEIVCYKEDLQIKAGAYQGDKEFETFQLGGHIHLGCNKYIKVLYWGEYLSFFCGIPLTLITDNEKKFYGNVSERDVRHKEGQYGVYGTYRTKDYGIEFRMPSSWLVSPQVTIGALSLAYVVGNEFINHLKNATELIWEKIFNDKYEIKTYNYIHWYNNQNWVLLQGEFEPIKLEIQQMELYPKYKEYIDYILDMIDNNETWHSEGDILPRWAELW